MDAATRTLLKRAISDSKKAKLKRERNIHPSRTTPYNRQNENATRTAKRLAEFANQHLYPVDPSDPLSDLVCSECHRRTQRRFAHNRHHFECKYRKSK